ncbi:MAG: hypothetical protein KGJ78_13880 [Alphaproteobacteria bacterium]|nr:hypothetical protein [Alphaproteobacteria bacterium]
MEVLKFSDDGQTPNNPFLPVVVYRTALVMPAHADRAAEFERIPADNGWTDAWRDGIYDHLHFHSATHEVLGIARGHVRVQVGGKSETILDLDAGDVVVLPAGTGHQRLALSGNLLVVGAYPSGGRYDKPTPSDTDHERAVRSIAGVPVPATDPMYGANGPLTEIWHSR